MKECDKRKNHINSKLHVICIYSSNIRHPVTNTFTPLHYTSANYISLQATIESPFLPLLIQFTVSTYAHLSYSVME